MLFVDGFEDTEAIATLDVLTRGKDEVMCASLMSTNTVTPKLGRKMQMEANINSLNLADFDGVILPGGPGSIHIMPKLKIIEDILSYFVNNNKLVAAICAAPHIIGKYGYLRGKNFTVHPGFEDQVIGGNYLREKGVVRDGNFITAKSMYYSIDFGLEIHAYFHGEESKEKLKRHCQGE